MAGLYIHIPFCKQACHYCNFHFSTGKDYRDQMIEAICSEIALRKDEISDTIETIYFGGGTPSIVDTKHIDAILQTILKNYSVDKDPEITLEANPDDINEKTSSEWKSIAINRFSIGIQSFSDHQLKWMNRAHNAEQSHKCIDIIRKTGFNNFSIDLIYGAPNQSIMEWEKDLFTATQYEIPHLSCYALTVEKETPLFHLIQRGEKQNISTNLQADAFKLLLGLTKSAGYLHYEISNFSLPGMESKHNSAYWRGVPYLGFGPSAHSFHHNTRSWNISNNIQYMQAIEKYHLPNEKETLSEKDQLNEYIMTNLRLSKGITAQHIKNYWGNEQLLRIEKEISKYLKEHKVEKTDEGWKLTDEGKFFADGIASDLFLV